MKTQAIVVREVHEKREERDSRTANVGVGQTPDETYNQMTPILIEILGYFDQIVQQNPQDLTAPRMAQLTTQLQGLLEQYNSEIAAVLQSCSDQLTACKTASAQTSTALQQSQAAAGVSPGAAAGIAVASAIGGGALGYVIRAKLKA